MIYLVCIGRGGQQWQRRCYTGFGIPPIPSSIESSYVVVPAPFPYSLCNEHECATGLATIRQTRLILLRVSGGMMVRLLTVVDSQGKESI